MKGKLIKTFELWTKRLKWYDISAIKVGMFLIAILCVKYIPALTNLDWYWYISAIILLLVSPLHSMFCEKHGKKKKFNITYKKPRKKK